MLSAGIFYGFGVAQPRRVGRREEEPDFSRSGNVALCLFTSKAMAVLRWSSPPKRSKTSLWLL